EGQEAGVIVTHFHKVNGLSPVPLVAVNTAQVPDAYKQWKALDDERKAEQAADASSDNDAGATASAAADAHTDDMPDVNDDVLSILDDFDGMDEGVDDAPQP